MDGLVRELTKQNIALQLALAKASSTAAPEPVVLGPAFAWLHPIKARLSAAEKAKKALRRVLAKAVRRRQLRVAMAFGLWVARSVMQPLLFSPSQQSFVPLQARRPESKIPVPHSARRKTAAPQPSTTAAEKTPSELVMTLSKQLDTQRVPVTALRRQKTRLEADATAQTSAIASLEASQVSLQRQMARLIKEVQSLRRPAVSRRDPPALPPLSSAAQQDELMEPLDLDGRSVQQ
ncbi:hypothetical protein SPRG_04946 [Saprolegnia parasitica CBS 223.65]|uniref:Uncharacterized protein n=1 Tax=Saprolegnia parasitica (strain CBS 223.65) TaxID=695850 RepID=A0A067CGJ8_SAPPC|nr:hypothetical protein SPRG_04946 [Saprolegnia parasitica CBS 223.65]KDO29879.1 hypothetical protein SPRG_04946 [Saprolegnia parasitica CBS 223.65]|eukprot:XP_012199474.1 hypothetical protein SPRG_04946 [Saprolegnia parasitica CBS 223.65]